MADDETEEYELTPHKELEELKAQVERLKKNPFGSKNSSKDLLVSMDNLTSSIKELIEIFRIASQDVKQEEEEESSINEKIEPITKKVDEVLDQNKQIAEGIVSVADTLKQKSSTQLPPEPDFGDESDDDEEIDPPSKSWPAYNEHSRSFAEDDDSFDSHHKNESTNSPAQFSRLHNRQNFSKMQPQQAHYDFPSPPPPMNKAEPQPYDFPPPPPMNKYHDNNTPNNNSIQDGPAPSFSARHLSAAPSAPPSPPPPPMNQGSESGSYKTPLPPLFSGPDDDDSTSLPPPQGDDFPEQPPKKKGFLSKFK